MAPLAAEGIDDPVLDRRLHGHATQDLGGIDRRIDGRHALDFLVIETVLQNGRAQACSDLGRHPVTTTVLNHGNRARHARGDGDLRVAG